MIRLPILLGVLSTSLLAGGFDASLAPGQWSARTFIQGGSASRTHMICLSRPQAMSGLRSVSGLFGPCRITDVSEQDGRVHMVGVCGAGERLEVDGAFTSTTFDLVGRRQPSSRREPPVVTMAQGQRVAERCA